MGVDWRLLNRYKSGEMSEERAELLYNQISDVDAETVSDVTNLQLLVSIAQKILQVKAVQADEAIEMVEKLSKKSDVERLKKENELLKQTLNSDEVDTSSRLQDYEEELNEMKRMLEQKEVEISKSRRKLNEMEGKLLSFEKENELLKNEIESLKEELDQKIELDDHLQESQESCEKLREKNRQVQKLLDELKFLESVNEELSSKVTELKEELREATIELNHSADEMKQLQTSLVSTHELNESLLKEKEYLMKEKSDLESETNAGAIKCKELIDSMVKMLAEKDVEINQLRERNDLKPSSSSFLPPSLPMVTCFDSGKELELIQVKSKLQEATVQLEAQNRMIEELQNELQEVKQFVSKKVPLGRSQQQQLDSFSSNPIYDAKIHELNESVQKLEEELKVKDTELIQVKERNKLYESGKYGLSDAINEIKISNQKLMRKESHIEELVKELNELKLEMNDTQDELEYIRECARLKGIDPTYDPTSSKAGQNDKINILKLQQELMKVEERNINLQDELRNMKSKFRHSSSNQVATDSSNQSSIETVHYLNERLNEVQEEKNQLNLAIREVLNYIRTTDSKSDVVVECPSLERILALIESRSIAEGKSIVEGRSTAEGVLSSKDLTNLITLKSELDLVRGQNEQLRCEMKALRIERKNLLSYCTQHILGENEAEKKSEEESNNNVGDDELDMSEGEVIPSSLIQPKVDQDTAGDADAISDDVRITKEEILGRGIKLVITEVLNESNDNEDENDFERDYRKTQREDENDFERDNRKTDREDESGLERDYRKTEKEDENRLERDYRKTEREDENRLERDYRKTEREDVSEEKSDISHETQRESGQEITRNTIVIREKVPCTKCPKAFAALEEVLKRMNKIISIIKQREQDKKFITTNAQQSSSSLQSE